MTEFSLLANHVYKVSVDNRAPSFCKCNFPRNMDINNSKQLTCNCGEEITDSMEWSWDTATAHPETHISGNIVVFHPVYSQGTSMIRGNKILKTRMHHYWEIKVVTCLSGTDIMLGVGTEKVDLTSHQYRFASVLGLDDQSWGYSYRGLIQHAGNLKYYAKKFSQGCIVGIHLDLFKGSIEFYLNRRPQGEAYTNIPVNDNISLYPMICSTSAKSSIKLINSSSFEDSLQFNCMKTLSKFPNLLEQIQKTPGLKRYCKEFWFLQPPEELPNFPAKNFEIKGTHNFQFKNTTSLLCKFKKCNENLENISATSYIPICKRIPQITRYRNDLSKQSKMDCSGDEEEKNPISCYCDH